MRRDTAGTARFDADFLRKGGLVVQGCCLGAIFDQSPLLPEEALISILRLGLLT